VDDVEALEQAAVLALPPALTEHVGGWLLRATPGVGRRRINAAADVAGDRALWLQVGTANPAGRLYARLGFGRCYGYAYRTPP